MRKNHRFILISFLFVAVFWGAGEGRAQLAPPPAYQFAAPPSVAVIPGTYVYVVPNTDILFHDGYWYRQYAGNWYWAPSYNGPWAYLPPPNIPTALLEVPPNYSYVPPGYPVIPYGEFYGNWARWEHERHWDRNPEWRAGWHREPVPERRREERFTGPHAREERHGEFREGGHDGFERRGGAEGGRGVPQHERHEDRRG